MLLSAPHERHKSKSAWTMRVAVALGVTLFIAVIGPFGLYDRMSFVARFLYSGGLLFALLVPSVLIRTAVFNALKGPVWKVDIIAAVLLGTVFGPVIWAFNYYVMAFDAQGFRGLAEHWFATVVVFLIPVSIRAYIRALQGAEPKRAEAPAAAVGVVDVISAPVPVPSFIRRLDPEIRGEVRRVSADDHKLMVYTHKGIGKVRMRFTDALHELDELSGARIHRSHWVAFDEIHEVRSQGRRSTAILKCGNELPVSQKYLEPLRDAGIRRA